MTRFTRASQLRILCSYLLEEIYHQILLAFNYSLMQFRLTNFIFLQGQRNNICFNIWIKYVTYSIQILSFSHYDLLKFLGIIQLGLQEWFFHVLFGHTLSEITTWEQRNDTYKYSICPHFSGPDYLSLGRLFLCFRKLKSTILVNKYNVGEFWNA